MNDAIRAAIISFINSVFPVLNLLGLVSFTSDEISTIMLLINNGLTLAMLTFKRGQEEGPPA